MTNRVEEVLRQVLVRNLIAFADEAFNYGMTEEEQGNMYSLADRLEDGTADEEDWIEAIAVVDING